MRRLTLLASAAMLMSGTALNAATSSPGLSHADEVCAQATSAAVQVPLTNAGIIDQTKVDNAATEIQLLAKQALPGQRTRQVFHLVLHEQGGKQVEVIATNMTDGGECPYQDPKAYVISRSF